MESSERRPLTALSRFRAMAYITTAFHNILGRRQVLSHEMFGVSITDDIKLPQELAAEGSLDELKAVIEEYSLTLKETDENGGTLLHSATHTNQLQVMQYLIDSGINLDAADDDGNTALHIAVMNGHIEALHLLLNSGASDTILNNSHDSPSHIVVRSKNITLVATFFEHSVSFGISGFRKRTPLHVIAESDNVEALQILDNLGQGKFDFCARDDSELTPVHLAARKGSHRVLDMIIQKCREHGYETEKVLELVDEEHCTPLHAAIDGGSLDVVQVLLSYGSKPTASDENQPSPLLVACAQGKIEIVQAMVEHCGKDILKCADVYGRSSLHYSASAVNSAQMIAFLVRNGIDISVRDNHGHTALHNAIRLGILEAVEEHLSHGADPLAKDNHGFNCLHFALVHNRKAIMNLLLRLPSAPQLIIDVNSKKESAIHLALKLGLGEALAAMAAIVQFHRSNLTDGDGNNYLHLAAAAGNWKALSILMEFSPSLARLNDTNNVGVTPLHSAAKSGSSRCIQLLLSNGAVSHKDHTGLTPFLVACHEGHTECAQILHSAFPYQRDWTDVKENSALHVASKSGNPKTIVFALDAGVEISLNSNHCSFLDLLIEKADMKCAMAVVKHPRWQECLDFHSPLRPHPMLGLIVHMPEVVEAVLDRCRTKAQLDSEDKGYWEKFDFKYIHLCNESTNQSSSEQTGGYFQRKRRQMCILRYSPQQKPWRSQPMELLQKMIRYKRTNLLTHPVVRAYLASKWRNYGNPLYALVLSVIFILALFLSIFILIAPSPFTLPVFSQNSTNNTVSNSTATLSQAASSCRIIILIVAILETLMILWATLTLGFSALELGWNGWVWVHLAKVVCVFVFLIPTSLIWEAGAFAVCLAWIAFAWDLQLFEKLGIYVMMLLAVTRTVLQVLIIAVFFFLGFSSSLFILVQDVPQFSSIGYSFFTTFGYMLGEVEYGLFVRQSKNEILKYGDLTFLIVGSLAIFLTIVMANLLVGLAVDDIEKIRFNAVVEKVAVEIRMFSKLDPIIPKQVMKRLDKPHLVRYPNANVTIIKKAWQLFWRSLLSSNSSTNKEPTQCMHDDHAQEIAYIRQRLDKLADMVEQIHEVLQTKAAGISMDSPKRFEMRPHGT